MKVIFIKDLKGQGKKDDIKEVKDGFGQNFLIKNNYAIPYSERNVKKLAAIKEEQQQEEQNIIKQAIENKERLEKTNISFTVTTGNDNKMFGSITSKQIVEELAKKGYQLNRKQIKVTNITSLGIHSVIIELYKDIKAIIKIEIKK
ncbi:MAG: 50S ribosomal protein L9 [Tenericutes bacterium]|jgi:large subunit ribosomal protein L9|nr:50S ribosomal protein L9 [Mycoplasmatota bacterium]